MIKYGQRPAPEPKHSGRPSGRRNVKTLRKLEESILSLPSLKAMNLLELMRSDSLWITATRMAIEDHNPKCLAYILSYLESRAYGRPTETVAVDVKHTHTIENIETARNVAREILSYNPPKLIEGK